MTKKIVIEPVTRVEGHGKVTIHLDDQNQVVESRLHIVEFRGFEKFVQGRPYWEAPVLVQRLCGICPVSHHLAAAKAIDQIVGIDPCDLTPVASLMRRLMHYGQIFQSHALHFFYLAAPDLLFGVDADPDKRNIVGLIQEHKDIALKGIQLRKFGQELIKATAGKKIHGISAVPGGIHKNLSLEEVHYFLDDKDVPSTQTCMQWMEEMLDFMLDYHKKNRNFLDQFCSFDSNHLSIVGQDGHLELYDGLLSAIDARGAKIFEKVSDDEYSQLFTEEVKQWTYLKFPYIKSLGMKKGWVRVGPLARLNVCDFIATPRAQKRLEQYRSFAGSKVINHSMYYHWARLIEMLHCIEYIDEHIKDPVLQDSHLIKKGKRREEGLGIIEAPRGTLVHQYKVDPQDQITKCNLVVSTTHNNEAMNQSVSMAARKVFEPFKGEKKPKISEALLNEIEVSIRAYDPCLSCATHAVGSMPLQVSLYDQSGSLLQERTR